MPAALVAVSFFFPPVAARDDAALGLQPASASKGLWPTGCTCGASVASSMRTARERFRTAEREPYRRSDAGFSRISNWGRRRMRCYFNSSWNDSPFVVGSAVFVCWSESQDWNSLSF